jgi:hypothetical protein
MYRAILLREIKKNKIKIKKGDNIRYDYVTLTIHEINKASLYRALFYTSSKYFF